MRHVAVATLRTFATRHFVCEGRARVSVLYGSRRPAQGVAYEQRKMPSDIATDAKAYPSADAGAHPNTDRSTNTNADKDTNTGTHRGTHACADTTPIKLPDASVGGVVMQWRRRGAHPRGRHTPDRPPAVLSDTELRQIMR